MSTPRLHEIISTLDDLYDPSWADDWDAVGTVVGDPDDSVSKVLFAVDPVRAVVDEAIDWGADLIVTHHPLLLRGVNSVAATTPKGKVVHSLIRSGIALHTCHTNADSPPGGVSAAMADAFGLADVSPLDADAADPLDKVVTFVPHANAQQVVDALAAAGAGSIGEYDRCHFASSGTGSFRPSAAANPTIGVSGRIEEVPETRLEMILPRAGRTQVLAALRAAHPYEEPAFDLFELAEMPGDRGSGRVGVLPEPMPLRDFAARVVDALPATSSVARVAGDPERLVRTVALCGGAGDFLLDRARSVGADVYVTSDLRHHPVSELHEHDEAPAVVDVPHWSAEWTWLPGAARTLADRLSAEGATVETRVSRVVTDPWAMYVPWSSTEPS
ncbi:Nif3-like dinuclear metal center hexameric protein [Solicola gregarius]|uniref:GTP cyclohydrolase 1 type 2 homolog n=1 Tax=Solicola gregarius TaxID=2908642 RepID=A0AA46YMA4_9ACTN|nr:Nif3-like dinuclear metal center hexameric protein [Solicola gregarius]UYM05593.1 Nif3-like dinuclear metal center hexameric protein [Solicola gregarius]